MLGPNLCSRLVLTKPTGAGYMASPYPYDVDLLRNGAGARDEGLVCFLKIGSRTVIAPSRCVLIIYVLAAILIRRNRIQMAFMQALPLFTPTTMRPCPLATPAVLLSLLRLHTRPLPRLTKKTLCGVAHNSHPLLNKNTSPRLERMAPYHRNHEATREEILS